MLKDYIPTQPGNALSSFVSRLQNCVNACRSNAEGDHVAEVYLTWFFGKGSTLFSKRYATQSRAVRAARLHAKFLDLILPKHYVVEDWSGRKMWEEHEYGINWGVRTIREDERAHFQAIDKRSLPGT